MSINKKYLGIRFPFTASDGEGFYIDMDYNPYKQIKSDLMHLIMTPKGSRIRKPEFGTNLLTYIFEPMDNKTNIDIKLELQESINKYFPGIMLVSVDFNEDVENSGILVKIEYQINEGNFDTIDSFEITI